MMFFSLSTGVQPYNKWWLIAGLAGILVLIVVRDLKKAPAYASAITSIVLVLVYILQDLRPMVAAHQFQQPSVTIWFFGVGVATLFLASRTPTHLGDTYWAQFLFYALTVLFLFATYYYPNIKASWGGGSPVPAVLYFSKDSSVKPGQNLQVQLLDESDVGFYIVGQNETKAIFVPRSAVSLVYFSDKASDSQLLK
jgi:hypothetical protein